MVFWFTAALLTLGASLAVLLPLARAPKPLAGSHDVEVYRDQLQELERDAARGLIGAEEAAEARAEIARRLIRAADAGSEAAPGIKAWTRATASAAVLSIPLVSWGIYASIGSPQLPPQPLQARLFADPASLPVEELIARAERHLIANPQDGRGWDLLAPIYLRQGRFDNAISAYRNALRLLGESAERQAGLGEALAAAIGGTVSPESQEAFQRALALDPAQAKARFFLAMALAQTGRLDEAETAWSALIAGLPAGSQWRVPTQQAIAAAESRVAAAATPSAAGPSADQVEAAAAMSPEQRSGMIEWMVAGLNERLQGNPKDRDGWIRLVRSYVVLGRADAARDALRRGVAALGGESGEARELADQAAALGVMLVE